MTRQWNFVLLGFLRCLEIPCCNGTKWGGSGGSDDPAIGRRRRFFLLSKSSFLLDIFLWLQVRSSIHGLEVNSQFRKKTTKILLKRVSLISSTTLRYKNHHIFACFLKKVLISIFFGPIICVSLLKILFLLLFLFIVWNIIISFGVLYETVG